MDRPEAWPWGAAPRPRSGVAPRAPGWTVQEQRRGASPRLRSGVVWAIPKNCSNYHTIALISHSSKVMLRILQARLQLYVNRELQMFKLVLEKVEEPEIKLPTSAGSSKKQESSRKTTISALLTTPKPSTVWITINCGKF